MMPPQCLLRAGDRQHRAQSAPAAAGVRSGRDATLAESIRAHGLLQPVVVRPWQGRYQLIAGERRLRAAMLAGWTDVPVTIVEADDRQMAELAIVENLQRKDLNALGKGRLVPTVSRPIRLHPGGTGRPAEARPLDDRQPDPAVGTARRGAGCHASRQDHAGPRPGPACRWATNASRSTSASGSRRKG